MPKMYELEFSDKRVSRKRSVGISAVISLILFAISSTAIAGPSAAKFALTFSGHGQSVKQDDAEASGIASSFVAVQAEKHDRIIVDAMRGDQLALNQAIDTLFFNTDISKNRPYKIAEIVKLAILTNPEVQIGEALSKIIHLCSKPKILDIEKFISEHNLANEYDHEILYSRKYGFIEEAANGGRFGKPNAELALQLACHSANGFADHEELDGRPDAAGLPESILIIFHLFSQWKNPTSSRFDVCNHFYTNSGGVFCDARILNPLQ